MQKPTLAQIRTFALVFAPIALVQAINSAITLTSVNDWYQTLAKPAWNPPNWVFGPVWTILYIMMALSLTRLILTLRHGHAPLRAHPAIRWSIAHLLLNFLWTPSFFGLQSPLLGLLIIIPLLAAILLTIRHSHLVDKPAALLLVPYALWVSYAVTLNGAIALLNH